MGYADIDDYTLDLWNLAIENNGDYDGLETSVELEQKIVSKFSFSTFLIAKIEGVSFVLKISASKEFAYFCVRLDFLLIRNFLV